MLHAGMARAAETCRFEGTASYDGTIRVETVAAAANGETTVDVLSWVSARSFGLIEWRFWLQERSVWRDGAVTSIAQNNRYAFAGRIVRQQWDLFTAAAGGLRASRVQANQLADFQQHHPGFLPHWDLGDFGRPWLDDFANAPPERRTDLDLPAAAMPPRTGPPLALGLYWLRFAAAGTATIPVFLPGMKHDARADVAVEIRAEPDGGRQARSTVKHPRLGGDIPSTVAAWITPDNRLARIVFDAHGSHGDARGDVRLAGCDGAAARP